MIFLSVSWSLFKSFSTLIRVPIIVWDLNCSRGLILKLSFATEHGEILPVLFVRLFELLLLLSFLTWALGLTSMEEVDEEIIV